MASVKRICIFISSGLLHFSMHPAASSSAATDEHSCITLRYTHKTKERLNLQGVMEQIDAQKHDDLFTGSSLYELIDQNRHFPLHRIMLARITDAQSDKPYFFEAYGLNKQLFNAHAPEYYHISIPQTPSDFRQHTPLNPLTRQPISSLIYLMQDRNDINLFDELITHYDIFNQLSRFYFETEHHEPISPFVIDKIRRMVMLYVEIIRPEREDIAHNKARGIHEAFGNQFFRFPELTLMYVNNPSHFHPTVQDPICIQRAFIALYETLQARPQWISRWLTTFYYFAQRIGQKDLFEVLQTQTTDRGALYFKHARALKAATKVNIETLDTFSQLVEQIGYNSMQEVLLMAIVLHAPRHVQRYIDQFKQNVLTQEALNTPLGNKETLWHFALFYALYNSDKCLHAKNFPIVRSLLETGMVDPHEGITFLNSTCRELVGENDIIDRLRTLLRSYSTEIGASEDTPIGKNIKNDY